MKEFFEDFEVGDRFTTSQKTLTDYEVNAFCVLTGHALPVEGRGNIHMDSEYARSLGFKDRVVPRLQIISYVTGLMGQLGLRKQALLFLGFNNVRFTVLVYPGDAIKLEFEVINKKEVRKWRDMGIITYKIIIKNQDDETVCEAEALYQYRKRT